MDNSVENSTRRRRNFRPVIFIAIPVVIIAGVVIAILANRKPAETPKNDQPETASTKTEEQKEEKKEEKTEDKKPEEEKPEEKKEDQEVIEGKTPVQQDASPSESGELTGVVNYAGSDGETVMIRASIDQYLESGTCLLELATSGDSFSTSDNITPSASTSSCSFDISTSLLINGKYNIKITLTSGNKTGVIEGEVDV